MKITDTERQALKGIANCDGRESRNLVETWVRACDANPFENARKFSGAMSSLIKKGLAKSDNGDGLEACVCLTADGHKAIDYYDPYYTD